jgi:WD domain, G-beta repeat
MRFVLLTVAAWLVSGLAAPAGEPPAGGQGKEGPNVSAAEIDGLILQLGDDDLAKRRLARKRLEDVGEAAVSALKKATESSDDPEVRKAAKAVIQTIEAKARGVRHVFGEHNGRVNGVAINADGTRALSASWDGTLRYWDLEEQRLIRQFAGHSNPAMSVVFSPDGKRALSGSSDRTMRLWDLETGLEMHRYNPPTPHGLGRGLLPGRQAGAVRVQ